MRSKSIFRTDQAGTPELESRHWGIIAIPAIVLIIMAILQIISFGKFRDFFDEIRLGAPAAWAVAAIILELWGALSLFKVNLNPAIRSFGLGLAVLVSGFWFIENVYLASSGAAGQLPNSGYFGGYLTQSPGWVTVLEASIMLFWVVYAAELLKWQPVRRAAGKA